MITWINLARVKGCLRNPWLPQKDSKCLTELCKKGQRQWQSGILPLFSPAPDVIMWSKWEDSYYRLTESIWPSGPNLMPSSWEYCRRQQSVGLPLKIRSWSYFLDKIEIDKIEVYLHKLLKQRCGSESKLETWGKMKLRIWSYLIFKGNSSEERSARKEDTRHLGFCLVLLGAGCWKCHFGPAFFFESRFCTFYYFWDHVQLKRVLNS